MKKILPWSLFSLVFCAVVVLQILWNDYGVQPEALEARQYNLYLKSRTGSTTNFAEHVKQGAIFVVWASWCPHCHNHVKDILKLQRKNSELNFIFINMGDQNLEKAEKMMGLSGQRFSFPTQGEDFYEQFGVEALPSTLIFSAEKTFRVTGHFDLCAESWRTMVFPQLKCSP